MLCRGRDLSDLSELNRMGKSDPIGSDGGLGWGGWGADGGGVDEVKSDSKMAGQSDELGAGLLIMDCGEQMEGLSKS